MNDRTMVETLRELMGEVDEAIAAACIRVRQDNARAAKVAFTATVKYNETADGLDIETKLTAANAVKRGRIVQTDQLTLADALREMEVERKARETAEAAAYPPRMVRGGGAENQP